MRLKLGRPDIGQYADRFDAPAAEFEGLSVTWMGVATLL
ncbi:MAG TPA: MBL fold metallo-hydrolase, partial [Mycobacterium sp.]|nr:MBL fold metallo-hydrolase [Mycobacterium sp.]